MARHSDSPQCGIGACVSKKPAQKQVPVQWQIACHSNSSQGSVVCVCEQKARSKASASAIACHSDSPRCGIVCVSKKPGQKQVAVQWHAIQIHFSVVLVRV